MIWISASRNSLRFCSGQSGHGNSSSRFTLCVRVEKGGRGHGVLAKRGGDPGLQSSGGRPIVSRGREGGDRPARHSHFTPSFWEKYRNLEVKGWTSAEELGMGLLLFPLLLRH